MVQKRTTGRKMGSISLEKALDRLREQGTAQNIKVYRRHGAKGELFGVSFAHIDALAAEIGNNLELARQLWLSGNADAMNLAASIADPEQITPEELDEWVASINFYPVADCFVRRLVAHSRWALEKMEAWSRSKQEFTRRCAYELATRLAKSNRAIEGRIFLDLLVRLERDILGSPNRARQAMLSALIAIGKRNEELRLAALAAAQRIGPVVIDHGQTGCKTPDAIKELT